MTFKAWRQRARIVLAIGQLATGTSISQVAAEAGFASTAAFCFAFRQVTRMTPPASSTTRRGPEPPPRQAEAAGPACRANIPSSASVAGAKDRPAGVTTPIARRRAGRLSGRQTSPPAAAAAASTGAAP